MPQDLNSQTFLGVCSVCERHRVIDRLGMENQRLEYANKQFRVLIEDKEKTIRSLNHYIDQLQEHFQKPFQENKN